MARPKPSPADDSTESPRAPRAKTRRAASASPKPASSGFKKWRKFWLILLGLSLVGVFGWSMVNRVRRGPEIPLPREGSGLRLGLTLDEAQNILGRVDKRSYNNDPDFGIVDLKNPENLPGNPEALDLVFYKDRLFFISQQWNIADASRDMARLAYKFRRWGQVGGGQTQNLGADTFLQEWFFRDTSTEMILRELKFPGHIQQMQDLRDASDPAAIAAFAKHRIDDWPK